MTSVPNEFVSMVRESVPAALVILADFVASTLTLESAWYMRNWGHYCLRGISMALKEDDYLKWLDWPKAQSHDNMVRIDFVAVTTGPLLTILFSGTPEREQNSRYGSTRRKDRYVSMCDAYL